ncbi:MAG: PKD domain-containing protein, partial [Ilumatobacteraceae bacterium]
MTVVPITQTTSAAGTPWSNTFQVVELPRNPLIRAQQFSVTLTGGPDMCADLGEHPWWSGTECWYPSGWGGNHAVTRLPDGRTAQMTLGYDCWRDNRQEWESASCTVRVGLPGFGYPSSPNPLYFLADANYRGTEYAPSGGAAMLIPIDWNVLYPDSEPVNDAPLAGFRHAVSEDDPLTVDFTNSSSDPQDPLDQLSSRWDFGDGAVSIDPNPSHSYAAAGDYEVALTVTDRGGLTNTSRQVVEVRGSNELVVNSTGDRGALDPAVRGCDTGELVGDDIECTFRAAVDAANALGGGEIRFAIEGTAVPEIRLDSALPAVAAPTTIDATTQSGGLVEVSGGGTTGIELAAGPSTVTGLAITGSEESVRVTGGDGHRIVGNRLGVDAAGEPDGTLFGAIVGAGSGTIVADNVIAADVGVEIGPLAISAEVSENTIGYDADGSTELGNPTAGVLAFGANSAVKNNVVRGVTVGISVATEPAAGSVVESNRVGVNRAGSAAADGTGYGIRVDGTPDVSIIGNRVVADAIASIAVAGSVQLEQGDDGSILFVSPDLENEEQPVTGGRTRIAGNVVGL